MITYGTKSTELVLENTNEKCPSCGNNTIQLGVYQKYAYVLFIPVFPLGKKGYSQCTHCKQALEEKEFPSSFKLAFETVKAKAKTPVWTFAGLVIFAGLIAWGIVVGNQNEKENKAFVQDPKQGDVYELKTKESQYTLFKVSDVKGDSVYVHYHLYETDKSKGLSDLKKKGDAGYSEDMYVIVKSELAAMLEKGEILDIER